MIRWVATGNDLQVSLPLLPGPAVDGDARAAAKAMFLFAAEHSDNEQDLWLVLQSDEPLVDLPVLRPLGSGSSCRVQVHPGDSDTSFRVRIIVPPAAPPVDDDELVIDLVGERQGVVPACRVILRRSLCNISTALLERPGQRTLMPQTRAALLWYGWGRYRQLMGLKRFTTGFGGSDVLVFRPRLRDRDARGALAGAECSPNDVCSIWGSCLLVKTGRAASARDEWDHFQEYLVDRLHPFMARSEAYLPVQPPGPSSPEKAQATIIGSFLGGDLLTVEPFEQLVRGTSDTERPLTVLRRLFSIMATWHAGHCTHPLREWARVFTFAEDGRLQLSGDFDLSDAKDRLEYSAGMTWDMDFVKQKHLSGHWLGKNRDGLLYRLMDVPVRFSLTHGDLHPRNILVDSDNVWLIDFGVTGMAPTLFDFAKLEIYLRLWCLDLTPGAESFDEAATRIESQMLDRLTGAAGGLESVRDGAAGLGADADDLLKVARCILEIRRQAMAYTLGSPDRSDYLAVLFLTLIHTLRHAAGKNPPAPANVRWLVALAWVLEDLLSGLVGLKPYERGRAPLDAKHLLTRSWLAAPGAPGRVMYFLQREDGRKALQPLAATRGVLQNLHHHLDVFDHTLLVLAYLEAMLGDDPSFCMATLDPDKLDQQVIENLRRLGIFLASPQSPQSASTAADLQWLKAPWVDDVRKQLRGILDDEDACLLLKWTALFHDVGKPATRCLHETRPQFVGHELYGRNLVAGHLSHLFPEEDLRSRMEHLIDKHHLQHQLKDRYLKDETGRKRLEQIRMAVAANQRAPDDEVQYLSKYWDESDDRHAGDFPLLIVHGYADALACRGPLSVTSLAKIAEVDFLLLAMYFQYLKDKAPRMWRGQVEECLKGLKRNLGLKEGPEVGHVKEGVMEWYMEEARRRAEAGEPAPSPQEVIDEARRIAKDRGYLEAAPTS